VIPLQMLLACFLARGVIPPGRQRPMTWRTFGQAHWSASWRPTSSRPGLDRARLVTFYTAFVLDVQSRRVQVVGCTLYPDEAFVIQTTCCSS
jgi:hypothetical protein